MRGVMTSASLGSRPTRICSYPRYIVPIHQASVTVLPSTSILILRSPSIRFISISISRLAIRGRSFIGRLAALNEKDHLGWRNRRQFLLCHPHLMEQRLVEGELSADAADA